MSRPTSSPIAIEPRPGLAKCRPEKDARRKHMNAWFVDWCVRNGHSQRYLAEVCGLSKTVVQDIFSARRSIHVEDLEVFPPRVRAVLAAELVAELMSTSPVPVSAAHR